MCIHHRSLHVCFKRKILQTLEMDLLPDPSPGETTETYTYKLASYWNIQLKYVIILQSNSLSPKYINLVSLVRTLLSSDSNIDAVCDYINRNTGRKWDDD